MAEYQLTASDVVIRTADQAWIPNDPANRDRAEYEQWLADGGVPDPYVPPAQVTARGHDLALSSPTLFIPPTAFPTLIEPGEIAVNTANRQLAVGDANPGSSGSQIPLLAVRYFDARAQYVAGDYVVNGGTLYRAKQSVTPAAFTPAQWDALSTNAAEKAYVDAGDAAVTSAYQAADAALTTAVTARSLASGDTMQGFLTLYSAPQSDLHAATKQYVDLQVAAGGLVTLPASSIVVTPAGSITATDAQAALEQLDSYKAPIYSPAFAGVPTAPLPPATSSTNQLATTEWVNTYTVTYVTDYMANYVGGQLTAIIGTATPKPIGTAAVGIATKYSREDHVHGSDPSRAPIDSPTFVGSPKAPTPLPGDNDTSLATTAFVQAAMGNMPAPAFGTGDVKLTYKTVADSGWVMMNDGTMGDASSGGTTRANADTQALFTLLWTNIPNIYCPVSGGRGVDAATDFNAHKTIKLAAALGRSLGICGTGAGLTARALGQALGEENHTLAVAEIPTGLGTFLTPATTLEASKPVHGRVGGSQPKAMAGPITSTKSPATLAAAANRTTSCSQRHSSTRW